jgi:uncharacterized protein with PQ loop repeat
MYVLENEYIQYGTMALASCFLIPQIIHTRRNESAKDVSSVMLGMIIITGATWALFMWEKHTISSDDTAQTKRIVFSSFSSFPPLCSLYLIFLQIRYYHARVSAHMDKIDAPPPSVVIS